MLTDDEQTETVTQIDYHLFRKRWSEAVKLANEYIRGEQQPAYLDSVLSWMPLPLLRLGRVAEAMATHDRGYRLTTRNAALVTQGKYVTATGDGQSNDRRRRPGFRPTGGR